MVSDEKNVPDHFDPGKKKAGSEEIDMSTTKNVKWVVKLGSQTYGGVVIGGGKILIGTNNESPRDPKYQGDRGILMCFDEKTGKFLWQLSVPKHESGKVNDWEYLGITSTPFIEGDRAYMVTNRCEVLCLDMNGQANGNDGPFKDEAQYFAGPGQAAGRSRPDRCRHHLALRHDGGARRVPAQRLELLGADPAAICSTPAPRTAWTGRTSTSHRRRRPG
jgi:hypothetical protein